MCSEHSRADQITAMLLRRQVQLNQASHRWIVLNTKLETPETQNTFMTTQEEFAQNTAPKKIFP